LVVYGRRVMAAFIFSPTIVLMFLPHACASSLSVRIGGAAHHSDVGVFNAKAINRSILEKHDKHSGVGNDDDVETVADEAVAEASQGVELESGSVQAATKVPGKVAINLAHVSKQDSPTHMVPLVFPKQVPEALHKLDKKLGSSNRDTEGGELTLARQDNSFSASQRAADLLHMKRQLEELRRKIRSESNVLGESATLKEEARELDDMGVLIVKMEKEESEGQNTAAAHGEMKGELARIRDSVDVIEEKLKSNSQQLDGSNPKAELTYTVPSRSASNRYIFPEQEDSMPPPTAVRTKGIDVDTEMPFGELEPFGREDTAQELTEASVRESDEMVDQLERAEVAEEKRAVFRALTRLRGAAITSFDGVARSQTGNIDGYSKVHRWRAAHPLHHLADEESDISKWAFPDTADF